MLSNSEVSVIFQPIRKSLLYLLFSVIFDCFKKIMTIRDSFFVKTCGELLKSAEIDLITILWTIFHYLCQIFTPKLKISTHLITLLGMFN